MNKITRCIIITSMSVFFIYGLVLAASVKINGLEFYADNIHIALPDDGKTSFLALDFVIYNSTETRKLDLAKNLKFSLIDEFGNTYSCRPYAGDSSLSALPFPKSIYPEQSFTTHLTCELPVSKATSATLQFEVSSLMDYERVISIPLSLPPNNDNNMSLRIILPENGTTVERGMLVHLRVRVIAPSLPDGIIIDAFNYTYEDRLPSLDNVYDLNIPNELAIGPQSINVIAKWKKNSDADIITFSDNIILNVRSATQVDVF